MEGPYEIVVSWSYICVISSVLKIVLDSSPGLTLPFKQTR
jgi:hypothetical protein